MLTKPQIRLAIDGGTSEIPKTRCRIVGNQWQTPTAQKSVTVTGPGNHRRTRGKNKANPMEEYSA